MSDDPLWHIGRRVAMDAEIRAYAVWINSLLERVVGQLEGLSDEQVNWRPPVQGLNSAYVIANHVLGNAEAWGLGIACGHRWISRDRPAEFDASGDYLELFGRGGHLLDEIWEGLERLKPPDLERSLVPSQELWGEGEAHEVSVREALLHVIEHASIHLGQLQITRDLVLRESRQ